MPKPIRLTDAKIAALKPRAERYEVFEDRGFGVRVTPNGRKTFILFYRLHNRLRRMTLGEYGPGEAGGGIGLAEAHERAAKARRAVKNDIDPAALDQAQRAERRRAPSVAGLADEYLARHAQARKVAKSCYEDRRILDRDIVPSLGALKVEDVRRRDVIAVLDAIADRGAPVMANRTAALLSKLFNFAVDRGVIDISPCARLPRQRERHKDRALDDAEIVTLWQRLEQAAMDPGTRLALKLVLVTGQRPGEVCGMGEDELEGATWTIPAARRKSARHAAGDHVVPLSPLALELIEQARAHNHGEPWLFPAPSLKGALAPAALPTAVRRNRPALRVAPFTPHDLRRSARTGLARLGVSDVVAERVLGHALGGLVAVYNAHAYDAEKRAALEAWGAHLQRLLAGEAPSPSRVVAFPHR